MAFDYNRTKQSHNGDSFWTSYSDLFLGLSTIFLLLYVTASLRTGTDAIQSKVENQKLAMQVQEMQSQLKMYENVKQNYLEKTASKSEVEEYQELMDKLTLLQEDAKDDSERLARQALENEKKATALNKYQQLVRNIINANKMAKTKVLARNDIIEEQDTEIGQLSTEVKDKKEEIARNQAEIYSAKKALEANKKRLLSAFKANQLSKKAYEEKTRALQAQSDQKVRALQQANQTYTAQLSDLSSQLKGTQADLAQKQQALAAKDSELSAKEGELAAKNGALAAKEGELAAKNGALAQAAGKIAGLSGQLAKAKEEMDARREVAREIQRGFSQAGIKADIDMQTGEVVLDFGDSYFDSDSAHLKSEMKKIIERAMPVYSKSLFGNPKVASKISAVEVIGFASPTYKGRFVDPNSPAVEDKNALKYNMDLSYRRANSIFAHLLEAKGGNTSFAHEKDLISLMKVSGRSFLEVMKVPNRGPASAAEFCKVNDCKKAQRVIVRFSMDGKK